MDPVNINCDIEDLVSLSMRQNFVPVVDDEGIFIGIIRRKDIIQYCYERADWGEKNKKNENSWLRFQRDLLPILRHVQVSGKPGPSLLLIPFFTMNKIFIFCMPQHQIFYGQLFCQQAGVPDGAVVFFIWAEALPFFIKTEGLVKEPVRVPESRIQVFRTWLIPRGKPGAVRSLSRRETRTVLLWKNGCP